mgnify:FL=1
MPRRRRIKAGVLVEHLAPFTVDVVHFAAVPERAREVVAEAMLHGQRVHLIKRRGFQVLGQAMRHIDAEAVGAVIGPEAQGLLELFVDVRIVPI